MKLTNTKFRFISSTLETLGSFELDLLNLHRAMYCCCTWTLWSFQKEGSSQNSKLWDEETAALLCPTTLSSSHSLRFRTMELCASESLAADFRRSGVFWTSESEAEGWSWKPNLLLIALAASDRNGIVKWSISAEDLGKWRSCVCEKDGERREKEDEVEQWGNGEGERKKS